MRLLRELLALLEATGDDKFDRMLGRITAQAKPDLETTVRGIADQLPRDLEVQRRQERWLAGELARIHAMAAGALRRTARELAPIAAEYREDTSPLELLYFHASDSYGGDDEALTRLADAYLLKHREDVEDAMVSWLAAFDQLKREAQEKRWLVDWVHPSVSKYPYERAHARSVVERLRGWYKRHDRHGAMREDVMSKDDELLAAVNGPGAPRASTARVISTTLPSRLRASTSHTRGDPVYYAFSYVPSEESTKLLSSMKGKGPYRLDGPRLDRFIEETAAYVAGHLKGGMRPDVITAPRSSSNLLQRFARALADRFDAPLHLNAFRKADHKLPLDRDAALAHIKRHYVDHAYLDLKYHGTDRAALEDRVAKSVYSSARRNGGVVTAKGLDKATAKFVKGIFDVDALENTLDGQRVLVVDDVLSSGASMNSLFQVAKDLGAAQVYGAVIFSRATQPRKTDMKIHELLAETQEKDIGTLEIVPDGEGFMVKSTAKSGPMLGGLYWVWSAIGKKKGVKTTIMTVKRYGKPQPTEVDKNDGMLVIDKRPAKMTFTGIGKEDLQVAVDKAIAKIHAEQKRNAAYKAKAPERKVAAAKHNAEKRMADMAAYAEKYGKGTWNRVTYRQEGGDDGYSYVVRVDGRAKWDGLTQRQAVYHKEQEVDAIAKREKLGRYAEGA